MTQRRYSEAEVREIFERAMHSPSTEPTSLTTSDGLTLADIQQIGGEVGVAAEDLARAAAELDAGGAPATRRTSLGMPISVGRTVPLPRALTDHEWEQLVAELRATFRARGRVASHGSLREWTNGNLHAFVEPTDSGYRLRLGTLKSDGVGWNALGMVGIAGGLIAFGAAQIAGALSDVGMAPLVLLASGAAALLSNVRRLPRWAREREEQMAHIAKKVTALVTQSPASSTDQN